MKKYIRKTITLPDEVYQKIISEQVEFGHRTFSSYVSFLLSVRSPTVCRIRELNEEISKV